MIKLICAFNDKEFTIDHREIVKFYLEDAIKQLRED